MKISKALLTTLILVWAVSFDTSLLAQSQTRDVGKFTGVKMSVPGDLYVKQGSSQKVVIEAADDVLDRIETEVSGGNLVIRQKDDWKWWKNWSGRGKIKVYVTAPTLEYLVVSGSGSIESENTLRSDNMYVGVSGSGEIDLDLDTGDLEGKVSGSGNVDLRGNADDIEISISGSGNFDAENLTANNCEVRISGSGNCRVHVKESLESRVSGSGNIYYKGDPSKVNNSSSGSGSLRKIG